MPAIDSPRFGRVDFKDSDVITFVRAILGFEHLQRFIIISRPESEPFKWLQCIDDPAVCFVIIEPRWVIQDYVVDISPHDLEQLESTGDMAENCIYLIATVPKGHPENISVNLKGPLVINARKLKAIQLVANNPNYAICHNIFPQHKAVTNQKT